MAEEKIKNLFIGTLYENEKFYIESIDLDKNSKKELIDDFLFEKENKKYFQKEKNIGFCLECEKNINENSNCKNHNIKYFNTLIINIEEIEKNLNNIIDNYKFILNVIEEKIRNFKKRNDNQILLAKKIIEIYKSNLNSNNLTYQTLLNANNILKFNTINKEDFIQNFSSISFEFNILKKYSIDNFITENISIQKIRKTTEIKYKFQKNDKIKSFIILEKLNKIIFNTKENIYLLNSKDFSNEDQIKLDLPIISVNLMNDKETILVCFSKSIQKLKINQNKIILEDFLSDIYIYRPGIIINYQDEYAWTNGYNIGFSTKNYYNIIKKLNINGEDYSGGCNINIIKLFQYNNDILYILTFGCFDHHGEGGYSIKLGLYTTKLSKEKKLLSLEACDFEIKNNSKNKYKIYDFKYNEIIIFGVQNIHIVDVLKWNILKTFYVSNNIIKNTYFLKNSNFLILLKNFSNSYIYDDDSEEEEKKKKEQIKNNIVIMKIYENINNIIFGINLYYKSGKLFYTPNNVNRKSNLNSQIINVQTNKINIYDLINIKREKILKINNN